MTSWRRSPLPRNWREIRAVVLQRDNHRCTYLEHGIRCTEKATDCDHIGSHDDHSLNNLRSLCRGHHRQRTAKQASEEALKKRPKRQSRYKHPGLIDN